MKTKETAKHYTFVPIQGMTCAACVARVEKGLKHIPQVTSVSVNLTTEQAALGFDTEQIDTHEIIKHVQQAGYDVKRTKITVPLSGLQEAALALKVEQAVRTLPGVISFKVNTVEETGLLEYIPGMLDLEQVSQRLSRFGFSVDLKKGSVSADALVFSDRERHLRKLKTKVVLGAFLSAIVFVLTMPMLFPFVQTIPTQLRFVLSFVLTSVVLFYSGWSFFSGFWKALKARTADMNSLVAIGAGVAYLYSTLLTFFPELFGAATSQLHVYFDTAAMITTFILFGRYLESRAKTQTTSELKHLLELKPRHARILKDGKWHEVPAEQVTKDQVCLVKDGENFPADGILLDDQATVDESMLTGESKPVNKKEGDQVIGGTVNLENPVKIQVLKTGEETVLGQIVQLIKEAQSSKPRIQKIADRVAAVFVPIVLGIALLTFLLWWWSGVGFVQAMIYFIAVVVVACPCALGLATPTAIMVATGRGAREGILIKNADTIQSLVGMRYLFFDKTGTLTTGQMHVQRVTAFQDSESEVLRLAAALEEQANHPIARAIVQAAHEKNLTLPAVENVRSRAGMGIQGTWQNKRLLLGNRTLMAREGLQLTAEMENAFEELTEQALTPVFVALENKVLGLIAVGDHLKAHSPQVVRYFLAQNIEPVVVSGDHPKTTEKIAAQAGIHRVYAQINPAKKAKLIAEFQQKGQRVGMVGDGINDAVALTQADVGLAMGSGTDVAMEAADVVLMGQDLLNLIKVHQLSKKTLAIMKQNFFWAMGYNVLMIPAAAGLLKITIGLTFHPAAAALAMAFSSVSVVSNSLRLKRVRLN